MSGKFAAFTMHEPGIALVAAQRDIIDANGRRVVRVAGASGSLRPDRRPASGARSGCGTEPTYSASHAVCCSVEMHWPARAIGKDADGYVIDLATYLKVLRVGDLVAIPESLGSFRVSAGQWSVQLKDEQESQVHDLRRRIHREWSGSLDPARSAPGGGHDEAPCVETAARLSVLHRRIPDEAHSDCM